MTSGCVAREHDAGLTPEKVDASLEVVHGFDTVEAVSALTRLLR